MRKHLTLQYWKDETLYVGKLKEFPGIFSQGKTLDALEDNIVRAYYKVFPEDMEGPAPEIYTVELEQ
jgi:predicted RNase H-like HicB family nuclease